jgi:hypothetical protein
MSSTRSGIAAVTALAIALACPQAGAREPTVAVLPSQSGELTSAMREILDETLSGRVDGLGWTAAPPSEVAASVAGTCGAAGCTVAQAAAVGEQAGASHVLMTVVEGTAGGLHLRMIVVDVLTAKTAEAAAPTDASGLLADAVKLLAGVMPEPPAPAAPEPPAPEPAAPAAPPPPSDVPGGPGPGAGPAAQDEPVLLTPQPRFQLEPPAAMEEAGPTQVDEQYEKLYRRSTGLMAAGGILTISGTAVLVASIVEWVEFVEWQKRARDSQCIDCIDKADEKIKTNAILTGVGVGVLLPGIITLGAGITQRLLAVKLREEASALLPRLRVAVAPGSGHLSAAWTF